MRYDFLFGIHFTLKCNPIVLILEIDEFCNDGELYKIFYIHTVYIIFIICVRSADNKTQQETAKIADEQ